MASPNSQFPSFLNFPSRQDDEQADLSLNNLGYHGGGDTQGGPSRGLFDICTPNECEPIGVPDRHNYPQGYGFNENINQMHNTSWTTTPFVAHSRSTSETTSLGVPIPAYPRRRSVPSNVYASQHISQSQPVLGYHVGSQQYYRYQQYLTQSTTPGPSASLPFAPLTIAPAVGGLVPNPHSASPPHIPWHTLQPSPGPPSQQDHGFPPGTLFPPHFEQGSLTSSDVGYSGNGRGAVDRTQRPTLRMHPYPSPAWGQMQGAGSPLDLSPDGSSGRITLEGSDSATSPGAESDPYYSFPNTPADTNGAMSEDLDEAALREEQRKEKQKLKKRDDREREKARLKRVKELLGMISATQVDTLEQVIVFFGGVVPARTNQPPAALPGRNRSGRATQVAGSRGDISRLFEVIGRCLGHTAHTPPKREVLLEEVVKKIEERFKRGTQPPGP